MVLFLISNIPWNWCQTFWKVSHSEHGTWNPPGLHFNISPTLYLKAKRKHNSVFSGVFYTKSFEICGVIVIMADNATTSFCQSIYCLTNQNSFFAAFFLEICSPRTCVSICTHGSLSYLRCANYITLLPETPPSIW